MPDPTQKHIASRKSEHIALCIDGDVGHLNKTNLFDDVELVHDALPEIDLAEIDIGTQFVGKALRAPLIIAAMTGGAPEAEGINRELAAAAEHYGIGFAFGSQRALLVRGIRDGYFVRDIAPSALIFGNIGLVQARETSTADLQELVRETGCDALCVHLNPAQEVVQPGGDHNFKGGLDTLWRLVGELGVPVIVKETGCGISRSVAERLVRVGVTAVDVSGAGGTSWVAVETARAEGAQRRLGERFRDWGIPTAASVRMLAPLGLDLCATGGVTSGLDVAKAIALGARVAGIARPFLQAQARGELHMAIEAVLDELRVACLLTGAGDLRALAQVQTVIGGRLRAWEGPHR